MDKKTRDLVEHWRSIGPADWAEGPHGWIGTDGEPITLHDWQRAVLASWWQYRDVCTTLAISKMSKRLAKRC